MHATGFILAVCVGFMMARCLAATEFHVAPTGTRDGDGSPQRPWDLQTALAQPAAVLPGDTIWLHGGVYRGSFRSDLKGREGARIVVQQAPGERAIIEIEPRTGFTPGFSAYGEWARFQGFEITCTHPKRRTEKKGSWPDDLRRGSVESRGSHLQFVNLLIHDLENGIGFWSDGAGGEIYGCLIFNNGWGGPDRGHGHAIYTQNREATKTIEDNILFSQFGSGLHLYGSSKATLKGFRIIGNIAFLNGCLYKPGDQTTGLLIGGDAPLDDVLVEQNITYASPLQIGYPWGHHNKSVTVRRNYVMGASLYFQNSLIFEENTVVAGRPVLRVVLSEAGFTNRYRIDRNTYFNSEPTFYPFALARGTQANSYDLPSWRELGFDRDSAVVDGFPKQPQVFVRPNRYEAGRAHIAVFNWAEQPAVDVNLEKVLKPGQTFRIVSARNFHGPAIVTGKYEGKPIVLPTQPVSPAQPVGMPDYQLPVTEPQFGCLVVLAQ
jgi:hypothetical protein